MLLQGQREKVADEPPVVLYLKKVDDEPSEDCGKELLKNICKETVDDGAYEERRLFSF